MANNKFKLNFKITKKTFDHGGAQLQLKADNVVITHTHSGRIRGARRRTINNRIYYSFERIPYAQPPVGELRFRAPKPVSSWRVSFARATAMAMSISMSNGITMQPAKPRPVMVWIYGGGYSRDAETRDRYSPDYFMREDIVLVTVQYRQGALGFLSLRNPHLQVPGNAALRDQIMALKWIRRNCASFGGDPEKITLFGQGSGANCTVLLMLSDQSSQLFQRAIAQSITGDWSNYECASVERVQKFAKVAGYPGDAADERKILKYLQKCTAAQLVAAEAQCLNWEERIQHKFSVFGPCVEPYCTTQTVLPKDPLLMMQHAWGNSIPLIVGATANEGHALLPLATKHRELMLNLLSTCMSFVPHAAAINRGSPECKAKGSKLRKLHVRSSRTPTLEDFCELASYAYFWNPMQQLLLARQQHARCAPTFLYRFAFASSRLMHPLRSGALNLEIGAGTGTSGSISAMHGAELAYLFHSVLGSAVEPLSGEYRTIKRLIGLWTTFAATGNPNGGKINGMKGITWRPLQRYGRDNIWQCLNIGVELKFIALPEMLKLRVWQELYRLHCELPQNTNHLLDLHMFVKAKL